MDRTSIIVIVVCFALMGLWTLVLMPKLYPPKPLPVGVTNAPAPTFSATNQAVATPPLTAEALAPVRSPIARTNVPEELLTVTNRDGRYTFTSQGGGVKLIELVQYPETVSARRTKEPQTNRVATLNTFT